MGGGDLNLKKSWHPSTLRNIERVWKAEQKHEVEKQKIEQLQKELAEERAKEEIQAYAEDQGVVKKREERLDWMYQGPAAAMVNRDDYLLGRKVDKTLELLEQEETGIAPKSDDHDIGASMFSSQDLSGTATVDLANKLREDPLFSIRKKEKEQRKNLLCNPVKMKQLQQMLQKSLSKDKKKNKKSHDSDGDRKHRKKHKKEERSSTHSSEDETKAQDHHHRNSKKFSSREDTPERYRMKEWRSDKHHSSNRDRDRHSSSTRYANGHSSREASQSYPSKQHFEDRTKRKMDAEERDRRLREMQEDARRMEEQRARKVRRYREDEEREEKAAHRVDASDFIKPLLSKAAGKGSVENRVKQKVFSIQRSHGDMDRHFARR